MNDTPTGHADDPERRRAVVFAGHAIGLRCLKVLLAGGVDVALVVTRDAAGDGDAADALRSLQSLCREHRIACVTGGGDGGGADAPGLLEQVRAARPDLIFTLDYRHRLPAALLALAPAYNMHASLLPEFRGDAPVHWAVRHGATVTGASLHELGAGPDADDGAIVSQMEVPILPDDTAWELAIKVTVAAEQTLWRVLPSLLDGSAPRLRNDPAQGARFGPHMPEDGRIDWRQPARRVYDLHRAMAPPYPGAFTEVDGVRYVIERARLSGNFGNVVSFGLPPGLTVVDNCIFGVCGDGRMLAISSLSADGAPITAGQLRARLQRSP